MVTEDCPSDMMTYPMPESEFITEEEAADILSKSTRTVRRYATQGKIDRRRVQSEDGLRTLYNRKQVEELAGMSGHNGQNDRGPFDNGQAGHNVAGQVSVNIADLMERIQQLAGQAGYWQGQAQQIKLLEERAQSLQEEKETVERDLQKLETEKQALQEQLEKTHEGLRREKEQAERRIRQIVLWAGAAIIVLIVFSIAFSSDLETFRQLIRSLLIRP